MIASLAEKGLPVVQSGMNEYHSSRHVLFSESEAGCILVGWNRVSAYRLREAVFQLGELIAFFRENSGKKQAAAPWPAPVEAGAGWR